MNERDYSSIYKDLGIEVKPLPANYDPEMYGKMLLKGFYNGKGVSYSAITIVNDPKTVSNN